MTFSIRCLILGILLGLHNPASGGENSITTEVISTPLMASGNSFGWKGLCLGMGAGICIGTAWSWWRFNPENTFKKNGQRTSRHSQISPTFLLLQDPNSAQTENINNLNFPDPVVGKTEEASLKSHFFWVIPYEFFKSTTIKSPDNMGKNTITLTQYYKFKFFGKKFFETSKTTPWPPASSKKMRNLRLKSTLRVPTETNQISIAYNSTYHSTTNSGNTDNSFKLDNSSGSRRIN